MMLRLAAQEIATLRKEAQAFKQVRQGLRIPNANGENVVKMVFQKVRLVAHLGCMCQTHVIAGIRFRYP